jgi:hypothetical protein
MTDDNTAPDEIAMDWEPGKALTNGPAFDAAPDHARWIRKDIADARVAAALEIWSEIIGESEGITGYHLNGDVASWGEFELPETPTDATAALDRVKREAFNEGVEKAAKHAAFATGDVDLMNRIRGLLKEDTDND